MSLKREKNRVTKGAVKAEIIEIGGLLLRRRAARQHLGEVDVGGDRGGDFVWQEGKRVSWGSKLKRSINENLWKDKRDRRRPGGSLSSSRKEGDVSLGGAGHCHNRNRKYGSVSVSPKGERSAMHYHQKG